ncbi:DUF2252 domain-containing protein [Actinospica durhamensis]|uniref:DUF2252 domain-containing protein n=1 Tax=Actinospica durhamensis TaxID=1508375 RepID=A0A941IPH4_9ACTN|nr:DUF2252 domain-containing protein [Actinospica durhamensis]MBR7835139.1 DUF2252 domain-containing protein [Actinospica durhamensis]
MAGKAGRSGGARPTRELDPAKKRAPTLGERAQHGTDVRKEVAPEQHALFSAAQGRRDPVEILEQQGATRVPELVPIRYGRMLVSPFTFYRGAAAVMAADLAATPTSGLTVQLCGDAHLANFGLFASPERRLVFDVNDFDETHPGPWEWDVKRLAASLEVAARQNGFSGKQRRKIQLATVRRYQGAMRQFADMHELDLWYASTDTDRLPADLVARLTKPAKKKLERTLAKARTRDQYRSFKKLTAIVDGERRITADPPLIVPISELLPEMAAEQLELQLRGLLARYQHTLQPDRRALAQAFEFVDMARKVVGVGSVGTRCWILLMRGHGEGDPLFLQAKEAQRSVLAEYGGLGGPRFRNEGERVVDGQRLMQAASDILLGWETVQGIDGKTRDFYVRQLADWKGSFEIEGALPSGLAQYGQLCGWTLARAHARSGDRVAIASYLGDDSTFAHAIAEFSAAYADQNERDYAALEKAERDGRITARSGV